MQRSVRKGRLRPRMPRRQRVRPIHFAFGWPKRPTKFRWAVAYAARPRRMPICTPRQGPHVGVHCGTRLCIYPSGLMHAFLPDFLRCGETIRLTTAGTLRPLRIWPPRAYLDAPLLCTSDDDLVDRDIASSALYGSRVVGRCVRRL
jgi:hypothetical protein